MSSRPHSSWAEVYDIDYQRSFGNFYKHLTEATIELISNGVHPPAKIVDFGAGTGRLAIPLAQLGFDVTAVEPCSEMLNQLKKKDSQASVKRVCSTMEDFKTEEKFDIALCVFTVILYLLDVESLKKALSTAYEILKPDGRLLIDIPSRTIFRNYSTKDNLIERRVSVIPENDNIYRYQEDLKVKEPNGDESEYSDEFNIRYWPSEYVHNILTATGFILEVDLTEHFSGTGSHYWIMKKAEQGAALADMEHSGIPASELGRSTRRESTQ